MSVATVDAARKKQLFWNSLRELSRPLVVYWIFLALMFAAFSIAALLDDPSSDGLIALVAFGIITAGSVLVGQLLTLFQVRTWVAFAYWAFMWTFGMMFGIFSAAVVGVFAVFIFIWVRASLPRYRYDQLMDLGWKVFLPITLGFMVFIAFVKVWWHAPV